MLYLEYIESAAKSWVKIYGDSTTDKTKAVLVSKILLWNVQVEWWQQKRWKQVCVKIMFYYLHTCKLKTISNFTLGIYTKKTYDATAKLYIQTVDLFSDICRIVYFDRKFDP